MLRCPYPNCPHIGTVISKLHCRIEHNLEREQIVMRYGNPKRITHRNELTIRKKRPSYFIERN